MSLILNIQSTIPAKTTIYSDESLYYRPIINTLFYQTKYVQFKDRITTVSGYGDLKKMG